METDRYRTCQTRINKYTLVPIQIGSCSRTEIRRPSTPSPMQRASLSRNSTASPCAGVRGVQRRPRPKLKRTRCWFQECRQRTSVPSTFRVRSLLYAGDCRMASSSTNGCTALSRTPHPNSAPTQRRAPIQCSGARILPAESPWSSP